MVRYHRTPIANGWLPFKTITIPSRSMDVSPKPLTVQWSPNFTIVQVYCIVFLFSPLLLCRARRASCCSARLVSEPMLSGGLVLEAPFFQLSVVYHMFWMPKTLWLDLWGHFRVPWFWPFPPPTGCFRHILRSDYSLPVTKRVQLDMK